MKQVFLKNGEANLVEIPVPMPGPNEVLVRTEFSCISPGTERAQLAETTSGSKLSAVIQQPEKILKAYEMLRTVGVKFTVDKIRGLHDIGEVTGYSLSGTVVEVGANCPEFSVGDRVACAGAGNAFHAEYVSVPRLLTTSIPEGVDFQQAATVTLGAIALQGIRRAEPKLGEAVGVIGLGALGLLTGLLLQQNGCRVIGFELQSERREFAASLGLTSVFDPEAEAMSKILQNLTGGHGLDLAIITAASSNAAPVMLAADLVRKKGKIVIVGNTKMDLQREKWYAKELDLLMSTSYGPGRYDANYEEAGQDYPYPYVRWSENRNMRAYLERLAEGLDVSPMIRKVFPIEEVAQAYTEIAGSEARPLLLLQYNKNAGRDTTVHFRTVVPQLDHRINVAIVGPGEFAQDVHLPNLVKLKRDYRIAAIVGRHGHNLTKMALTYDADYITTDFERVLQDPNINLVFITTRHHLHADLAKRAAEAGKAIFLEKPMAVDEVELNELEQALRETKVPFLVGFNRRFSPFVTQMKSILDELPGPMMILYRVNTVTLPETHWIYSDEGAGPLIGEGCHFIDLLNYLTGSTVATYSVSGPHSNEVQGHPDANFQVNLTYRSGSTATLFYSSLGSKSLPKEYMEVYCNGSVSTLDNYKRLEVAGISSKSMTYKHEEKGHLEELKVFAEHLRNKRNAPISLDEMVATTRLTLQLRESLHSREKRAFEKVA